MAIRHYKKISELNTLTSASLNTYVAGVDNGQTVKIELNVLADGVRDTINSLDVVRLNCLQLFTASYFVDSASAATTRNTNTTNIALLSSFTGSYATTGSNTFIGNEIISGTLNVSSSFTASLQNGYTWVGNGNNISTAFPTASLLSTASFNSFTSSQYNVLSSSVANNQATINALTASLGATSNAFSFIGVTNPTNLQLVTYLTASFNGGVIDILAVNNSNATATSTNYQFASYGANAGISQNGKQTSGAGAPNLAPSISISGSYTIITVTLTGTYNIKGVARLF